MPSNIITVQVGQCGNQIGMEFWKTMCEEHGIGPTGTLISEDRPGLDQKGVHFYETEGGRYMPRSVLVDLEPRVVNLILNSEHGRLYNMENVFHSKNGGGAGNNWASGYNQPADIVNDVLEILRREAENADSLEGFTLYHSISGGTGSGLGSKVLEEMRQNFPKCIIQTYSAFSNLGDDSSDVIVGPYNSILTLDWLMENTDLVVTLDNRALYKVAVDTMREKQPTFEHINSMISRIIAGVTAPMRFYSPIYTRLSHIAGYLNPFPPMQFIQTAYSPFAPANNQFVINTTPSTILSRVLEPKSMISSTNFANVRRSTHVEDGGGRGPTPPSAVAHCMLSGLAVLRSDGSEKATDKITDSNVGGALRKIRARTDNKNMITYPPWSSSTLHITTTKLSPYMQHRHHTSGLLLANHTNISIVLQQITHSYDAMRRRKAYINSFEREGKDMLEQMNQSREKADQLIRLYEEATTMGFMDENKEYVPPPPVLNDNPLFSNILSSANVKLERGGDDAESAC